MPRSAARVVTPELVRFLRGRFRLDWTGIHGAPHWARVRRNGLLLAERTGANRRVIELFALLHDCERTDDGHDPGHGARAASLIEEISSDIVTLSSEESALLVFACHHHSDGCTEAEVTIQTCWDSDRLDLGRVGIRPQARYLCTPAARDPAFIRSAYERSVGGWRRG